MPRDSFKYFKESSLRVDSSSLRCPTIELTAPDPSNSGFASDASRASRRRQQSQRDVLDPEEEYSREHIASASSIYYRTSPTAFPRALLWRVLCEGHVLDIEPVDQTIPDEFAPLQSHRIRIRFSSSIKPACVTFNEAYGPDAVVVDVLTESLTLYSFMFDCKSFTSEWVRKPLGDWVHTQESAHFNLRPPHYMISLREGSLVLALQDGGLMKIERSHPLADDYTEQTFSDGSYLASLKGMFLWGSGDRVKGHSNISTNLVVSMVADSGSSVLITASINNTLKLWSLDTLTSLGTYDIINDQTRAQQSSNSKQILSIEQTTLVSLSQINNNVGYVATYCPLGEGQFKIWKLDISKTESSLTDVPGPPLVPSTPDENAIWMISDFVLQHSTRSEDVALWILWKSNKSSKIHVLFDIPTTKNRKSKPIWRSIGRSYIDNLSATDSELSFETEDATDKYRRRLFQPQVLSPAILETVLPVYAQHYALRTEGVDGLGTAHDSSISLYEKVSRIVGAAVTLQADYTTGEMDYELYNRDLQQQWSRFERLCLELSKQGNEALSLVQDPVGNGIMLVRATFISSIRSCVGLEFTEVLEQQSSAASRPDTSILLALASFKKLLPRPVISKFVASLTENALTAPTVAYSDRVNTLYEDCLAEDISDSALAMLHKRLYSIENINSALENCYAELVSITEASRFGLPSLNTRRHLTSVGIDLLGLSFYSSITASYESVVDILLFLVVYTVDGDVEYNLSEYTLFHKFLGAFKTLTFLKSLGDTVLMAPAQQHLNDGDMLSKSVSKLALSKNSQSNFVPGGTIIQFLYSRFEPQLGCTCASDLASGGGFTGTTGIGKAIDYTMSYWSITDDSYACAGVLGALLSAGYVDESKNVMRFLQRDGLGCYLRARVYLESGEHDKAALYFSKSVTDMSQGAVSESKALALHDFVAMDGASSSSMAAMGVGVSGFCDHVAKILYQRQAFAGASKFYRLALDSRIDADAGGTAADELYYNLFQSALQAALYDEAYMAMSRVGDDKLRAQALSMFISTLCLSGNSARLCEYAFLGQHGQVEDMLEQKARDTIDLHGGLDRVNYYKVLYSWRVEHGEYREAAAIMYEYVQRLRNAFSGNGVAEFSSFDMDVSQGYLVLLNTLSCMTEDAEPWFLARRVSVESDAKKVKREVDGGKGRSQRVLVMLSDVEREYRNELQRMEIILNRQLVAIDA